MYFIDQIPGFAFGAIVGAIVMFFVARKNPEWIQEMYNKQKGVTSDVRKELDEAKAKLAALELNRQIEVKIKELLNK